MAYVPTTFVDRSVEFPNRRKLTAVSGQDDTFDVARAEGTVFAAGTKLDAANLNAEFGKIKTETDAINSSLTAVNNKIHTYTSLPITDSTSGVTGDCICSIVGNIGIAYVYNSYNTALLSTGTVLFSKDGGVTYNKGII